MKRKIAIFLLTFFALLQIPAFASVIVADANPGDCGIRASLVSGVAVGDGSNSGNGTIYGIPYKGGKVALYDGYAHWRSYLLASQIGYAFSGITAGNMYDLYIYWNGTSLAFDTPVQWSSPTTMPTRTIVNGVSLNPANLTRRLVCSFYATGTNLTMDWMGARCLSNHQNRVPRAIYCYDSNDWSYLGDWRPGDGATNTTTWLGQEFWWMASSDGTNVCTASDSQGVLLSGSYCTALSSLGFAGQTDSTLQGAIVTGNTAVCMSAVFASQLSPGFNSCCHYECAGYNTVSYFPLKIQGLVEN